MLYIGLDIGGTKIAGGIVTPEGKILSTQKDATPEKPGDIFLITKKIINNLLKDQKQKLGGIGIAIPGIVDGERILAAPNAKLAGYPLAKKLAKHFQTKVIMGNDVNFGTLGEAWLGSARGYQNVLGIFPGTGVGGGVICDGKLLIGHRGAAAEIGHLILNPDGPLCNCGNQGCLEAYAGRWAIERDILKAIKEGKKSIIPELTDNLKKKIKSKILAKALEKKDKVTIQVMTKAAQMLGIGCVSARHAYSPEIIVLGGGVIEACGWFILPIVEKIVNSDPFFGKLGRCKVVKSKLGDAAVILGAAKIASQRA